MSLAVQRPLLSNIKLFLRLHPKVISSDSFWVVKGKHAKLQCCQRGNFLIVSRGTNGIADAEGTFRVLHFGLFDEMLCCSGL